MGSESIAHDAEGRKAYPIQWRIPIGSTPPPGVPSSIPNCDLSEQRGGGGETTTNSIHIRGLEPGAALVGGEWSHRCVIPVSPSPPLFGNSPPNNDRAFSFCFSYLGTTLRQANIEPMPSISDVRRVITEFAILPLGNYMSVSVILANIHSLCGHHYGILGSW